MEKVCRVCGTDRFCQECSYVETDADLRALVDEMRAVVNANADTIAELRRERDRAREGMTAWMAKAIEQTAIDCQDINKARAERDAARGEAERYRAALEVIAEPDALADANPEAFSVHAVRRMREQARAALASTAAMVDE